MPIFPIYFLWFFNIRECIFQLKSELKRMENSNRARRVNFFLFFWWESDLGLSWKHLRSILGRLGKFFRLSWALKTRPRCAKMTQNRPQEPPQRRLEGVPEASGRFIVTKKHPRAAQNPPDLDFGASGFGFWKCFSWIFARFFNGFNLRILAFWIQFLVAIRAPPRPPPA